MVGLGFEAYLVVKIPLLIILFLTLLQLAHARALQCRDLVGRPKATMDVDWTPYSKGLKTPTVLSDKIIIHLLKDEGFRLFLLKQIKAGKRQVTDFKQIADAEPLYNIASGPVYPKNLNSRDHDGTDFSHRQLLDYVLKNYRLGDAITPDYAKFSSAAVNTGQEMRIESHPLQQALIRQGLLTADAAPGGKNLVADALQKLHKSWEVLLRRTEKEIDDTKLFLPNAYVVAGGRFRESYFWDSFWIMKGLIESGYGKTARGMLENYVYLFEKYGIIPNGNRFYYLTRTQFPVFLEMVTLLEQNNLLTFKKNVSANSLESRILKVSDGYYTNIWRGTDRYVEAAGLFRYSDGAGGSSDPHKVVTRPEAGVTEIRHEEVHAKRAAAESGWDFSYTRFGDEPQNYLPVDLNFMLMGYTEKLAGLFKKSGYETKSNQYQKEAVRIKSKLNEHLLNQRTGLYLDYKFAGNNIGLSKVITAASFFPFYFGMYDAASASKTILKNLLNALKPKNHLAVHTTDKEGAGQWDGSWSWAPLNEIAFQSLLKYGLAAEAKKLAFDYSLMVLVTFYKNGNKYFEKFRAEDGSIKLPAGSEIYGNEEGFGWTNGTVAVFLHHLSDWGLLPALEAEIAKRVGTP